MVNLKNSIPIINTTIPKEKVPKLKKNCAAELRAVDSVMYLGSIRMMKAIKTPSRQTITAGTKSTDKITNKGEANIRKKIKLKNLKALLKKTDNKPLALEIK